VAVSFVGGAAHRAHHLRPVENAPVLTNVIVFIGLLVIFNGGRLDLRPHDQGLPEPVPEGSVRGKYFSAHELGSIGVMLVVLRRCTPSSASPARAGDARGGAEPGLGRLVGIRVAGCWRWAGGWPRRSARSPA
jgi:branched-chain amino acid transport system permease protein